jgi:hypothetical protein
MKKLIFSFFGMSTFLALVVFNTFSFDQKNVDGDIMLKSIIQEAQAGTEGCTTTPGSNTGACKKNINGVEWNCIVADSDDVIDCSSD